MQNEDEGPPSARPMSPELEKRCEEIRKRLIDAGPKDVLLRYGIGTLVRDAKAEAGKYGDGAVQHIGKQLGFGPKTLYRCAAVAAGYTAQELLALVSQQGVSGLPLRWPHVALLSSVTPGRRADLVQAVLDLNLSPADLKKRLRKGAKRSPLLPSAPDTVLMQRGLRSVSGVLRTLKKWKADCLPALTREATTPRVAGKVEKILEDITAELDEIHALLGDVRSGVRRPHVKRKEPAESAAGKVH